MAVRGRLPTGLLVLAGLLLAAMLAWLARADIPVASLGRIGPQENREVNINNLREGPRGWVIGSTEENGWMFLHDPASGQMVQWNAGRIDLSQAVLGHEGDITDFDWWLEDGDRTLVILAAQAYPGELYRYRIALPERGLPAAIPPGEVVFKDPRWKRVMAVQRGLDATTGQPVIVAGSYGAHGEVVISRDNARTWQPVGLHGGSFDARRHGINISVDAAYAQIVEHAGRWILGLIVGHLMEEDQPWLAHPRRMIDAILISENPEGPYRPAEVDPRADLPEPTASRIASARARGTLHPLLFNLVGEGPQHIQKAGACLVSTIGADNDFVAPFGGRVVLSRDGGLTWREIFRMPDVRDLSLGYVAEGDYFLIGTMAKNNRADGSEGQGELWLSSRPGRTDRLMTVVRSAKPSRVRTDGSLAVGVSVIQPLAGGLVIGTVNEGESAELLSIDTGSLLWQARTRWLRFWQGRQGEAYGCAARVR